MIDFPMILSGPILRRVEAANVHIWIATSQPCEVNASLYKLELKKNSYQKIDILNKTSTVKLGMKLFVHLVKVSPQQGMFPVDTLLGYNLHFRQGTDIEDLESLHLLSVNNPNSIAYPSLKYPTFQIKSAENKWNIVYGSCRKLHGEGDDTLLLADYLLEKESINLQNRPDAIFLMGDQIYADDVGDPAVQAISHMGKELAGFSEPLFLLEKRMKLPHFQKAFSQINGRQYIMENFCQFTSSSAQNHLAEISEFAVMYLLSWSPELWKAAEEAELFISFEEAVSKDLVYFSFPDDNLNQKGHKAEFKRLKKRYAHQEEALQAFQQELYRVRRLFANTPVYMILDDHDLTDDWNLSYDWKKNVWESPMGRHVIANGLTAYWAFQGWGNDPDAFEDSFIHTISSYLGSLRDGGNQAKHETWVRTLWNFHSWHFVAPTTPMALFLDTRTQRDYDQERPIPVKIGGIIEENVSCPELINLNGWENTSKLLTDSGWESGSPLIIVAATPVYGIGLVESVLLNYIYPLRILGIEVQYSFDFEAWKDNGKGFTAFLEQAAGWNPSPCVILSGDVHYASSVKSVVTLADGRRLNILQCTSSPLKNLSFTGFWGLLMKMAVNLNAFKRKKKEIQRYCTLGYTIMEDKNKKIEEKSLWKDRLAYQNITGHSIIEQNNNLGLLSITREGIQNQLYVNKKQLQTDKRL